MYYKNVPGVTSTNSYPLNSNSVRVQMLYLPSDFQSMPVSGTISKIYFRNNVAGAAGTYTNFKISFLQNSDAAIPGTAWYTGMTEALNVASATVNANPVIGGWFEIALATPFVYDNTQSLIIEVYYTARVNGITLYTSTGTNRRLYGGSASATGTRDGIFSDFGMDIISNTNCSGTPNAGNALSSVTTACAGEAMVLGLSVPPVSGQTYQWQSSPTGLPASYNNIAGADYFTLVTTQSSETYYRCNVTCTASSQTSSSGAVQVPMGIFSDCYCETNLITAGGYSCLSSVSISTIVNNSGATCPLPGYTFYPSTLFTADLEQGQSYTLSVTNISSSSMASVWIDYDRSGTFDASEWQSIYNGGTSGSTSITIPMNATPGETGMRLRSRSNNGALGAADACTTLLPSGETEDYIVKIVATPTGVNQQTENSKVSVRGNRTLLYKSFSAKQARIDVYDISGKHTANLMDGFANANEQYSFDLHELMLSPGIYFYRVSSVDEVITGKMFVIDN